QIRSVLKRARDGRADEPLVLVCDDALVGASVGAVHGESRGELAKRVADVGARVIPKAAMPLDHTRSELGQPLHVGRERRTQDLAPRLEGNLVEGSALTADLREQCGERRLRTR